MSRTIRQTVYFDAAPHDVYEALMDSRRHAAFTGEAAKVNRSVGGAFSTFGGWSKGTMLELEADRLIVQSWRSKDFRAADPESRVTFRLSKQGGRTRLVFVQANIPETLAKELAEGWREYYWNPLKAYLARRRR